MAGGGGGTSTSTYVVNTQAAIDNVNKLSKAYIENNQALGGLISQFGTAKQKGKDVYSSFTQITESGQKVTTTVKEVNGVFSVMAIKVAAATLANKRLAEQQALLARTTAATPQIQVTTANSAQLSKRFNVVTGSDIQAAVDKANQLTLSLAKGNAVLGLLNDTSKKVQIAPGLNQAKLAVDNLKAGLQQLSSVMNQISKIALATVIYRGLSLIQQGLSESIHTAADYYKQIALVQTLAGKSGESFASWSTQIEKVANELGLPVTDVAKAAYDGLSNQVIKSSKDFELLRQSFILAKTTGSDAGDSLNLLSSIINGFTKSTSEAEDLTNKFFTIVDLGKVKIQELKDTIGRSASLSKTLGVSFEELASGIAVITQTGVGAAESTTLLNNIFVQLLKPNEDLKKALSEMGFLTGQSAIATLKFSGVLAALGEKAKGTADGLATFFPEIRGLRGVAALSGTELAKFEKTLDAVTNSSGRAAEALKIVQENAGQKFADELQRIKNFFTTDIGTNFLKGVIGISDQFGGLSTIVKEVTIAIGALSVATAGFVIIGKTINLATTLGTAVQTVISLSKVTGGLGDLFFHLKTGVDTFAGSLVGKLSLFAVGFAAVDFYLKHTVEAARLANQKIVDDTNKAADLRTQAESRANQKIVRDFDRAQSDKNVILGKYLQEQVKLNNKALDAINERSAEDNEKLRNRLDVALNLQRQHQTDLEQVESKATATIRKIQDERNKANDEAEKDQFQGSIDRSRTAHKQAIDSGRNEIQANNVLITNLRSVIVARNAVLTSKRNQAIAADDIESAGRFQRELLENVKIFQEEQVIVNGITRFLFNQNEVFKIQGDLGRQYNALLAARVPLLQQESTAASASGEQQKNRVKDAEDLFKKISKFNETVVKGEEFSVKFADDPFKALDVLDKLQHKAVDFINSAKGIKDQNLFKDLGNNLDEVIRSFNQQRRDLAQTIAETQRRVALAKADRSRSDLVETEKALVRSLIVDYEKLTTTINKQSASAIALAALIGKAVSDKSSPQGSAVQQSAEAKVQISTNRIQNLLNKPVRDFKAIDSAVDELGTAVAKFGGLQVPSIIDPNQLITLRDAQSEIRAFVAQLKGLTVDSPGKQFLDITIQNSKIENQTLERQVEYYKEINRLKDGLKESDPLLPQIDNELAKVRSLIQQLEQVKSTGITVGAVNKATGVVETHAGGGIAGSQGGFLLDFLSGRFKKGTDIIPAMLTRGERVMRAPIAEKYATMLDAMNRNRLPVYRAEGSPNSGSSVGSINVNMPKGTTQAQVREFAKQVGRGIKQGTIRL